MKTVCQLSFNAKAQVGVTYTCIERQFIKTYVNDSQKMFIISKCLPMSTLPTIHSNIYKVTSLQFYVKTLSERINLFQTLGYFQVCGSKYE